MCWKNLISICVLDKSYFNTPHTPPHTEYWVTGAWAWESSENQFDSQIDSHFNDSTWFSHLVLTIGSFTWFSHLFLSLCSHLVINNLVLPSFSLGSQFSLGFQLVIKWFSICSLGSHLVFNWPCSVLTWFSIVLSIGSHFGTQWCWLGSYSVKASIRNKWEPRENQVRTIEVRQIRTRLKPN